MYSFDPVGSYEREACRAAGAAQALVQPFLDNQVSPRRIQRLRCAVVSDVPICSRLATVINWTICDRTAGCDRYTSRTRKPRRGRRTRCTCRCQMSSPSSSTRLRARRSATSRCVPLLFLSLPFSSLPRTLRRGASSVFQAVINNACCSDRRGHRVLEIGCMIGASCTCGARAFVGVCYHTIDGHR